MSWALSSRLDECLLCPGVIVMARAGIWMVSLMPSMITIIINIRVGPTSDRKWDIMTETVLALAGSVMLCWPISKKWRAVLVFTLTSFMTTPDEPESKSLIHSLPETSIMLVYYELICWEIESYPLYNRQHLVPGARLAAVRKPGLDGVKDQ